MVFFLHLDASGTMCLVNRRGLGKAKHVDMQNLWIQEVSQSGRLVTENVGTIVNPVDLMSKPLQRPKIEHLHERVCGYWIRGAVQVVNQSYIVQDRACPQQAAD